MGYGSPITYDAIPSNLEEKKVRRRSLCMAHVYYEFYGGLETCGTYASNAIIASLVASIALVL